MEFHEKLQQLRKNRGLTQEELAASLFVSRTAISKWESGRGYPNIDSLRAIAKFFSVSIDELLSGAEILSVAESDHQKKQKSYRDMVLGLLDASTILLAFLPVFAERTDSLVRSVSLIALYGVAAYLKFAYWIVLVGMIAIGILILALQNCQYSMWVRHKCKLSIFLSTVGVSIFILSLQPYAAIYLLIFLAIKVMLLVKKA